MADPYIPKNSNDLIRAADWNQIQIQAREEIASHTHAGDQQGTPIDTAGLANGAVETDKLADQAVTTDKLADGAITAAKLGVGVLQGSGVARTIQQANHGFVVGQAIFYDRAVDKYGLALANADNTLGMFMVSHVASADEFTLLQAGFIAGLSGLTPGEYYYVSDSVPGGLTADEPLGISNPILFAERVDAGYVLPYRPSENSQALMTQGLVPTGAVMAFAGESVPIGWLLCDGQEASRSAYSALFAVIGVSHGEGDGATTFHLPDYRGRFLRGVDRGQGRDPDSGARYAAASGGNTGDAVGTLQGDSIKEHSHNILYRAQTNPNAAPGHYCLSGLNLNNHQGPPNQTATHISGGGGVETRPHNAYINYMIKI